MTILIDRLLPLQQQTHSHSISPVQYPVCPAVSQVLPAPCLCAADEQADGARSATAEMFAKAAKMAKGVFEDMSAPQPEGKKASDGHAGTDTSHDATAAAPALDALVTLVISCWPCWASCGQPAAAASHIVQTEGFLWSMVPHSPSQQLH